MISVSEALQAVCAESRPRPAEQAEDIASDVDSPPHDKALVDGYAVQSADVSNPPVLLKILEQVTAGEVPQYAVRAGTATRIMTGAPIPDGADVVVMVEDTEVLEAGAAVRIQRTVGPGANLLRQGVSMRRGDRVLSAGCQLRPMEIGLLAEVGRASVRVRPSPRLAVLATGDELVDCATRPGAGQIRNSNGPMLVALAQQAGAVPTDLGVARDNEPDLRRHIQLGLQSDVLVLSGGVSAGVLDLTPRVLADLGVHCVFHKVNLKPGKPLWFGVRRDASSSCLVFGLPGNPVSSLVCFELFVRPAIAKLKEQTPEPALRRGVLAADFRQKGDRLVYHPAVIRDEHSGAEITLLSWKGSSDLRTLVDANALAIFPPGDRQYRAGETIDVHLLAP
jgi:molybdopterin molybdotransferase